MGKKLSEQEIERIILEDKTERGKEYLLNLLSRRIYSKYEISRKLDSRGYSEKIIIALISWLENNDYINDELFASIWAQSRMQNKPMGRYKLNQELKIKGIKQETIQKVIDKAYGEMDELSLARNLIREKVASAKIKDVEIKPLKIYNFLIRRGFPCEVANTIYHELKDEKI